MSRQVCKHIDPPSVLWVTLSRFSLYGYSISCQRYPPPLTVPPLRCVPCPDRVVFFLHLEAEPRVHRLQDGNLLPANDIARQLTPEREFTV